MVSLREPGLGPIVGHTTDTTARIWVRASDPADDRAQLDENRRTIGVIGILEDGKINFAWYFRLNREFDRTGTFVLGSDVQLGYYDSIDLDSVEEVAVAVNLNKNVPAKPLTPNTAYTVRVGVLTVDDPTPNTSRTSDLNLIAILPDINIIKNDLLGLDPSKCEATFRTFPPAGQIADTLAFLLGSCRYPGLLWKIKEADQIFGPMSQHFKDSPIGPAASFTMMCGDQIYADMLNRFVPILRAERYDEFQERYTTAYSAQNLRNLLQRSSTYMILDDHEIEDNWTQDRLRGDPGKHMVFNYAVTAYMNYQWSHSPRTWGRLLYYTFDCGGYPFFVLDTRTQRYKNNNDRARDNGLRDNYMLGYPTIDEHHPGQMRRLKDWLSQMQKDRNNVPKFIVSSSVFVPNAMDERIDDRTKKGLDTLLFDVNGNNRDDSDSWPAFPQTRKELLDYIVDEAIQNVVFLSGDIHCSNVAEISFERDQGQRKRVLPLRAFAVTSSAFYWPFPFADGDPNGYVHDSRLPEQWDAFPLKDGKTRMHYKSWGFTQDDNFARLEIDRTKSQLKVRVFDRNGKPVVNTEVASGKNVPLETDLQLEPWT
ncbi:alkaline phosphatase D family protein [Bradyrhizobium centrosematis]|uniref:alkaline phosphatase D family protein n=1 Tax=Bradyrhizobium centrosematis TaxID=1300039 RepID=UPI00216A6DA1|nr:alkaline phosphatase D family protein [Bradyrhizobium centrosematis]MCS3761715.1 alkaline phosphatase D [Bradyrhizobium centrosematis]MCS3774383.1 alkaline phosphatase D [Bradyrhizobium centrosematis]